jgi:hypothetical protein
LITRNPTAKPEFKKTVPAGVTAKSVIENFIAIGGLQAVNAVKNNCNERYYYPQATITT